MHQKPSENVRYHVYECLHTPGRYTRETEILHNETTMLPEGNISNGRLRDLSLSSKSSLHRKVAALKMPTVPTSDLSVNPTWTQPLT